MSDKQHTNTYQASCKLMLFGEYLVLEGSNSLAFPLKYSQSLEVTPGKSFTWESYSRNGRWFEMKLHKDLNIDETNDEEKAKILQGLIQHIHRSKPSLDMLNTFRVRANFNMQWGIGSSSTLISILAQWSGLDPYELSQRSFGGSGYDIACATASQMITYRMEDKVANPVELNEAVTDKLLFIYSGSKQSSKDEIKRFEKSTTQESDISTMDDIINQALAAKSIEEFEVQIDRSEDLLSPILGLEKLKQHIFADYEYSIKSLGAWGGDFFLATYRDSNEARDYFREKGYETMFTYNELLN